MNEHIIKGNEALKLKDKNTAIEEFLQALDDKNPIVHRIAENRLNELVPCAVYGSSHSNLYHRVECPGKKAIYNHHLIQFKDWKQAEIAGYSQCPTCKPPKVGVSIPQQ